MIRNARRWALVLAGAGVVMVPRPGAAQQAPSSTPPSGIYANPYANPYLNPFLNPYMTQTPVDGNPALYFFAAQQATGGLGSGKLSGVRGTRSPATIAVVPADPRRPTDIPGASASHYFNRKPQNAVVPGQYYNRQKPSSQANRH